jgi:UDP-N-acetylglucosamine 2-epimerase (non-hydrolysing)
MSGICFVVGTRPEFIKLVPVYKEAWNQGIHANIVLTGQHTDLLNDLISFFDVTINHINQENIDGDLNQKAISIQKFLTKKFEDICPDLVVVQGDTVSTLAGALVGFFKKIPIVHVEAGLRTYDLYNPFPEEGCRQLVSRLATFNFSPTERDKANLVAENIVESSILVVGNTSIDALTIASKTASNNSSRPRNADLRRLICAQKGGSQLVVITLHRSENRHGRFRTVFSGITELAKRYPDLEFLWLAHPHPDIQSNIKIADGRLSNFRFTEALSYQDMVIALNRCAILLTDSGGLQEEGFHLGIPVGVFRAFSERIPDAATINKESIVEIIDPDTLDFEKKLCSFVARNKNSIRSSFPTDGYFGDGFASSRIIGHLKKIL